MVTTDIKSLSTTYAHRWGSFLSSQWASSLFEDGTENKAIRRMVNYVNPSGIRRNESEFTYGYSVRCMKDVE